MQVAGRLGALAERNFRLVFSSVTISVLGDGVTTIALAFAVLMPLGSAVAGPVAALVGSRATLLGTFGIAVACFAVIFAQPSVWAIAREPAAATVLA